MNSPTTDSTPPARQQIGLKQALGQPLLHFVLLGAVIFAADQYLANFRDDTRAIQVASVAQREMRDMFVAGMKREPSADDMRILVERWVDNEVLYREGLALGVDRGDSAIRDRVIFKTLSIAQSGLSLPALDEAQLRAWFEARRDRYDQPARFDFLEAVLQGDATPHVVKGFVDALNGAGQSQAESGLRVFKDRPRNNLLLSYGPEFTAALETSPPGKWQALTSQEGLRVVRLESIKPGSSADFEDLKTHLYQDWRDDTKALLTTQAVREMGKKYRVQLEPEATSAPAGKGKS